MSSTSPRQGLSKTLQSAKTRIIAGLAFLLLTAVISASALAANNDQSYVGQITASISSFLGLSAGPQTSDGMSGILPQPKEPLAELSSGDTASDCDTAPEGLIACYRADADANDAKGAHNGRWVGAAGYTQGKVGEGSFSFNGKSHVEVPNDQELNPANVTVSGWVNLSSTEGTFSLMSKGDDYTLQVKGGMVVFSSRNAKGVIETLETPFTGQAGTWMHIAATHDGATRTLYINGEEAINDKQAGLFRKDASNLVIGMVNTEDANFSAQADEVMLFSRALTAQELAKISQPNAPLDINTFTILPSPVGEGAGFTTVTVNRNATNNSLPISVNFTVTSVAGPGVATAGAACTPGVDFVLNSTSVSYVAGETGPKSFTIQICQDLLVEGNETAQITATIVGSSETVVGNPGTNFTTFTIADDDTVAVTASAPVAEGTAAGSNGQYTFTFDRGAASVAGDAAFAVPFQMSGPAQFQPSTATSAQDYVPSTTIPTTCSGGFAFNSATGAGTATFGPGVGARTCTVTFQAVVDDFVETNENLTLTVAAPIGNPSTATTTINNDDNPFIHVMWQGLSSGTGQQYAEEGNPGPGTTLNLIFVRGLCSAYTTATPSGQQGTGFAVCPGGDLNALQANQTADYTVGGSATNGTDYTPTLTSPVTFTTTSPTQTIVVTPTADTIVEDDETIIVTVTGTCAAPACNLGSGSTATAFINDDDEDVRVATPAPATISEAGPGGMTYAVTRNKLSTGISNAAPGAGQTAPIDPTADPLSVNFSFLPAGVVPNNPAATCTDTSDFTVTNAGGVVYAPAAGCNGTIAFLANVLAGNIVVTPTNDAVPENDENVTVNITPASAGNLPAGAYGVGNQTQGGAGANAAATGVITNDDFQVTVRVSPLTTLEDSGVPLVYTFTRIGQTATALCANFSVSGTASATVGPDYTTSFGATAAPCVNNFTPGVANSTGLIGIPGGVGNPANVGGIQSNQNTFIVTPMADTTVEPDETVFVRVDNPALPNTSVYTPGNPSQDTGTIVNDDSGITISVSPNSVLEDGATNLVYTFTRTANLGSTLVVSFDKTGTACGAAACADGFSTDFDQFGATTFVPTNGTGTGQGTITFAAGSPTATITIDPRVDANVEPDETVTLTLTALNNVPGNSYTIGAPNSATGTITNDDTAITVAVAPASEFENSGTPAVFTFTRTSPNPPGNAALPPLTININIGGTATAANTATVANPADYTGANSGNQTVTFAAGSPTATITITPVGDTTVEPDETVIATVLPAAGNPYAVGNPSSATNTILNDDNVVTLNTTVAPASVAENSGTAMVYTINRTAGGFATDITVGFTFGGGTNPATCANDFTVSGTNVTFVNGAANATCSGTVFIPAANNSATINVTPVGDTTVEQDETVRLTITTCTPNGPGCTIPAGQSADGTILNDDTEVSVQITTQTPPGAPGAQSSAASLNENSDPSVFIFTFTRNTAGAIASQNFDATYNVSGTACFTTPCADGLTQDYTVALGSAGSTFNGTNGTGTGATSNVRFIGNATTSSVTVDPSNDQFPELNETVILTVVSTNPGVTGGTIAVQPNPATATILNDDNGIFSLSCTPSVQEPGVGGGPNPNPTPNPSFATCSVGFTGANVVGNNTVTFQTLPLTATQQSNCGFNNADYQGVVQTFTSVNGGVPTNNSGVGGNTVTVPICFDSVFETTEYFLAQLSNSTANIQTNASTAACGSSANGSPITAPAVAPTLGTQNAAGQCGSQVIAITDNNVVQPVITLQASPSPVPTPRATEGNTVFFTVTQNTASGSNTTFQYFTNDNGSGINPATGQLYPFATSPTDYLGTNVECNSGPTQATVVPQTGPSTTGPGAITTTNPVGICTATILAGQTSVVLGFRTITDNLSEGTEQFTVALTGTNSQGVTIVGPTLAANNATLCTPQSTTCNQTQVGLIDDANPSVTYSVATSYAQAEGTNPPGGPNPATPFPDVITRVGTPTSDQIVCYYTQSGNANIGLGGGANPATPGQDYVEIGSPAAPVCSNFPANQTSITVFKDVLADSIFEFDQTFSFIIAGVCPTGTAPAACTGSIPTAPGAAIGNAIEVVTIQNDDLAPTVGLRSVNSVVEGNPDPNTGVNAGLVGVTYAITNNGTTTGTEVPITATITVTGSSVTAPNPATIGGTGTAPPGSPAGPSAACTANVDLFRVVSSTGGNVNVFGGTASTPFTGTNQTINALAVCRDLVVEGNEGFTVTLNTVSGGVIETNTVSGVAGSGGLCANDSVTSCTSKNATIFDDDVTGAFFFTDANGNPNGDVALPELTPPANPQNFVFNVNRAPGSYQYNQVVTLQTLDGTATVAGLDYNATTCTVTFTPTTTGPQPCTVTDIPDANQELDETFTLQITGITGLGNLANGSPNTLAAAQLLPGNDFIAQGTILNDDGGRVASINSVTQNEGNPANADTPGNPATPTASGMRFRIDFQGTSAFQTTYTYRTQPAGTTAPTPVPVPSPAGTDAATETSTQQTANVLGGNDPTVNLADIGQANANAICSTSGANLPPITGADANGNAIVVQRPDYIGQNGTVTVPANAQFADIVIYNCTDNRFERNEQYIVVLTPVNLATGTVASTGQFGVGTIVNDDIYYIGVTQSVLLNEGNSGSSTATFTLTQFGSTNVNPGPVTVTVAGSGTNPATIANNTAGCPAVGSPTGNPDVIFSGSAGGTNFNPATFSSSGFSTSSNVFTTGRETGFNSSATQFQIPVCGDLVLEPDETASVTVTTGAGTVPPVGANVGTLTILNDGDTVTVPTPTPTPTPTPSPTPAAPGFEGDINRTVVGQPGTGDGDVNVGDQLQYLRFLNGTDCPAAGTTVANLNEQQRLDAASRATLGDGLFGSADGAAIDAYARHDASTDFNPNTPAWDPTPAGGPKNITNLGCTATAGPEGDSAVSSKVTEPEAATAARVVRWVSPSGPVNTDVFGEVEFESQGNEGATQYSLHFNPAVVSISNVSGVNLNPDITLGAGAPAGTTLNVNAASAAAGDISVNVNFNGANTNPPTVLTLGTKRITRFKFHILATAPLGVSPVTFTNTVVNRLTFDAAGQPITTPPYIDGNVTVTGGRTLKIGSSSTRQLGTAIIPVTLQAVGNEFGVSLTANFDPTLLSITGVAGVDVLPGATTLPASCTVTLNNTGVAQGRLGIGIGCPQGGIPVGLDEILRLRFTARAAAVEGTQIPVTFGNTPINTEVGDNNGNTLTVDRVPGVVTILGRTAAKVSISGRVTTPSGAGLRNATVTLTDADGNRMTVTTSSFGSYQFDEVESGHTYVMGVSSRTFRFSSRSVTVSDSITNMDFVGSE